jgi:hypothetical protein
MNLIDQLKRKQEELIGGISQYRVKSSASPIQEQAQRLIQGQLRQRAIAAQNPYAGKDWRDIIGRYEKYSPELNLFKTHGERLHVPVQAILDEYKQKQEALKPYGFDFTPAEYVTHAYGEKMGQMVGNYTTAQQAYQKAGKQLPKDIEYLILGSAGPLAQKLTSLSTSTQKELATSQLREYFQLTGQDPLGRFSNIPIASTEEENPKLNKLKSLLGGK